MYENLKTTLGFIDTVNKSAKTTVEKFLYQNTIDKRYNNGVQYTRIGYLLNSLIDGRQVIKKENEQHLNKLTGQLTKPKTEYRLFYKTENLTGAYTILTKSEYEFCIYCIEKGLTTQSAIDKCIRTEEQKKEEQRKNHIAEQEKLGRQKEFKIRERKNPNVFYILCDTENKSKSVWKRVWAEPICIQGHSCFIYRENGDWIVTLTKYGLMLSCDYYKSRAIEKAEKAILNATPLDFSRAEDMIDMEIIPTIGQNPLYRTMA